MRIVRERCMLINNPVESLLAEDVHRVDTRCAHRGQQRGRRRNGHHNYDHAANVAGSDGDTP